MKVNFLIPAAMVALLAGPALAQSEAGADQQAAPQMGAPIFQGEDSAEERNGYFAASPDQVLASSVIGKTVYNGTGEDAEALGTVNDVVMAPNGQAQAVVIGVGGFLGIGEKEVALDFANVSVLEGEDETFLVTGATRADLEAAPAFDRAVIEPAAEGQAVGQAQTEPANGDDADSENGKVVPLSQLSAEQLVGARVYSAKGRDIGEVSDVLLGDQSTIEAYLVDVGGFLGVGEKTVALAAADLAIRQSADGWLTVETPFTQEQLDQQVEYSQEQYQSNPDEVLMR